MPKATPESATKTAGHPGELPVLDQLKRLADARAVHQITRRAGRRRARAAPGSIVRTFGSIAEPA